MLLWINGPFGGGKTQTAFELRRRLPGSVICDPEEAGFGLHRMLPADLRGDFQDMPAWRQSVFECLDRTARAVPGPVIVPMTVVEPVYFDETVGRLRENGLEVAHFSLMARRATVVRRLRRRHRGGEGFGPSKLDLCLERLAGPEFATHVWTDDRPVSQVAEQVAALAGLELEANHDSAFRGKLRRR
jgi:hypothetical protein